MINDLAKEIHNNAKAKGFYDRPFNMGEKLMLITSELSEALEANREGKEPNVRQFIERIKQLEESTQDLNEEDSKEYFKRMFEKHIKNSIPDELADAIIRILDLAQAMNYDMEWHIAQKMKYNAMRPFKHGKAY